MGVMTALFGHRSHPPPELLPVLVLEEEAGPSAQAQPLWPGSPGICGAPTGPTFPQGGRAEQGKSAACPFAPWAPGHRGWDRPGDSSHGPSICHDAPGKNTVKYCFFIPFITLTRCLTWKHSWHRVARRGP